MKTISVRQPWAWLIVNGYKDIENRTWYSNYRGELLIHASKSYADAAESFAWILRKFPELRNVIPQYKHSYDRGGIVGKVQMVDCVNQHSSKWFVGEYGFVFQNPQAFQHIIPCNGQLGIFDVDVDLTASNNACSGLSGTAPESR